jgi:acetyl/propionyl-CoA carboxylase alpha subunit
MGEAAVAIARAADYRNAGTVEFLLDGAGDAARFYFLEMNARLQVEHPITEQVAGVDLVRAQISIAANEPLPWTQEALTQRGHAIELRIYAEDPARGHLPQAGTIALYREPSMPGIRIDSGVTEGSDVSVHYDPLLAKLIAYGETREIARVRARAALASYPILGIRTNSSFLMDLLDHERFVNGDVDTRFLDGAGSALGATVPSELPAEVLAVANIARTVTSARIAAQSSTNVDPWTLLRNLRV